MLDAIDSGGAETIVYDNGSDGTDHGEGNCMLLTGGAVRGGMYGSHLTDADWKLLEAVN